MVCACGHQASWGFASPESFQPPENLDLVARKVTEGMIEELKVRSVEGTWALIMIMVILDELT
jgi:hypothetical protein